MTQATNASKDNAVHFSAGNTEGTRRATGVVPAEKCGSQTEVVAHAQRRRFSTSFKQAIVHEANACTTPGSVGAMCCGLI